MPFEAYADFYDLLYSDKDYDAEVDYLLDLIREHRPRASRLLDLGCGTGRHGIRLAQHGYGVTGVDCAPKSIQLARERARRAGLNIEFHTEDIRSVRLNTRYDIVTALFHVMSYQTNDSDLLAAFRAAAHHLGSDGIFVFDCWYGPAVLSQGPEVRIKRAAEDAMALTRIAEPKMVVEENRVDVHYALCVDNQQTGEHRWIRERHPMRYLFSPEIKMLLDAVGLRLVHNEEWLTGKPPGLDTWGVCYVAEKKPAAENCNGK